MKGMGVACGGEGGGDKREARLVVIKVLEGMRLRCSGGSMGGVVCLVSAPKAVCGVSVQYGRFGQRGCVECLGFSRYDTGRRAAPEAEAGTRNEPLCGNVMNKKERLCCNCSGGRR